MAGLSSLLGVLSTVQIAFYTRLKGKYVGHDQFGNKYYTMKAAHPAYKKGQERRFVLYKGEPDASKVPPQWHGWLHHQTDVIPSEKNAHYKKSWQVEHRPNMTGTAEAYRPPGHVLQGGRRDKATGDYEAWSPPE